MRGLGTIESASSPLILAERRYYVLVNLDHGPFTLCVPQRALCIIPWLTNQLIKPNACHFGNDRIRARVGTNQSRCSHSAKFCRSYWIRSRTDPSACSGSIFFSCVRHQALNHVRRQSDAELMTEWHAQRNNTIKRESHGCWQWSEQKRCSQQPGRRRAHPRSTFWRQLAPEIA